MRDSLSVREVRGDALIRLFTALPEVIRRETGHDLLNTDPETEMALLRGQHVLSKTLQIQAYLFLDTEETNDSLLTQENCLARIALIRTDGQDEMCFGYFAKRDCLLDISPLLEAVERAAKELGATCLIGPVNGSFWLSYRFKIDSFDLKPYFGEPRNPAGYPALFEAACYRQANIYRSNYYPPGALVTKRMQDRLGGFQALGYTIRTPRPREQEELITDLHGLISELYLDFPLYHKVDLSSFRTLFGTLPTVADFRLLRIAYKDGQPVGFLIALPDYQDRLDTKQRVWKKLLAILGKRRIKQTVLLYLGAKPDSLGLGSALVADFARTVRERKLSVIAALIEGDKVTGSYAHDRISQTRRYALYRKDLTQSPSKQLTQSPSKR